MKTGRIATASLLAATLSAAGYAAEGPIPTGVPHLDHVFLIMMENHGYGQIIGNPNAPFINQMATTANSATNYFGVAHPSLTNYLEVVGGSNFGVLNDNNPDWHSTACTTNLASGTPATDNPPSPSICPIEGTGADAATPAVDLTNETQGPPGENNIDGIKSIAAATDIDGKTIGDQLTAWGRSWKSYQESLPPEGADIVNYSDGYFTNNTDFSLILPQLNPPLSQSGVVSLYAVKHNPFAYFRSVQEGINPRNSLANTVGFDGPHGLFADLRSGHVPAFSFIAPNQCNDQHGRGNAGPFCLYDPTDDGTQAGLNPALIYRGDVTVRQLVAAIKASPAWREGRNAIVVLWDENDYSTAPNTNQVPLIVDTSYGPHGVSSSQFYDHFSLLKSLEAAFGLPCLNHACDPDVSVVSDLFSDHDHHHHHRR
jgi:phosphatidylinositol-3-phosphatase